MTRLSLGFSRPLAFLVVLLDWFKSSLPAIGTGPASSITPSVAHLARKKKTSSNLKLNLLGRSSRLCTSSCPRPRPSNSYFWSSAVSLVVHSRAEPSPPSPSLQLSVKRLFERAPCWILSSRFRLLVAYHIWSHREGSSNLARSQSSLKPAPWSSPRVPPSASKPRSTPSSDSEELEIPVPYNSHQPDPLSLSLIPIFQLPPFSRPPTTSTAMAAAAPQMPAHGDSKTPQSDSSSDDTEKKRHTLNVGTQ